MSQPKWVRPAVILLIVVVGGLPLGLHWLTIGRIPSIGPQGAKDLLSKPGSTAILVDVRPEKDYTAKHLEGAWNWPFGQIKALTSREEVPEAFSTRPLLLICESGIVSGFATRKLRSLAVTNVTNVTGGMQAWVGTADKPCGLAFCRVKAASGATSALPFREAPAYEQWAAVVTGFGVKPVYMLLSLVLVGVLWRRRAADLVALRWAMILFFAGEMFCALNYGITTHQSDLLEYLHSFGMVLCFGFTTYAIFEAMDERLIKYSDADQKCAAVGLCRGCIKYTNIPCGLKRMFLLLIPAAAVMALLPFCSRLEPVSYNTRIFGTFYNYSNAVVQQIYEMRLCPLAAIGLLIVSFLLLALKRHDPVRASKIFFAAAMGPLGFAFFRLFLFTPFRDNLVWFNVWEEITELLFVVCAGAVLWVFRRGLTDTSPQGESAMHRLAALYGASQ
jgi:rhodanese-related sulfurtransferase